METKEFISLINENINVKKDYSHIKYEDLKLSCKEDILLLIISKHIFFFGDNKFKYKGIREKTKKNKWIDLFIKAFCTTFKEELESELKYGTFIKYFCEFYDNIKKNYIDFLKELEKIKTKIDFDLFEAAVCFMCYLNKNTKYLNIISDLKKDSEIRRLEIDNDKLTKNYLYYTITDYCILYNIPIIPDEEYDLTDINKDKIISEIKELKCYAEVCPINKTYNNFLLLLCSCLENSQDLRIGQEKNVKDFIELIFIMLNIHLRKPYYWKESHLSSILNDIYKSSFQYCTENFNENYIDCVISYITKYEIGSEDFASIFLKGLNQDEFKKTFVNLQLKENINNINNKETIQYLINKMYKKNKNGKLKNITNNNFSESKNVGTSISLKKETPEKEIINTNNKEISSKDNRIQEINNKKIEEKTQEKMTINNNNNPCEEVKDIIDEINTKENSNNDINKKILQRNNNDFTKEKNEIKDIKESKIETKEIIIKKDDSKEKNVDEDNKKKKIESDKNKDIKELLFNLKKEMDDKIQSLQEENQIKFNILEQENIKKDIEIKQLKENIKNINLDLQRISFRDLSKRVLNGMIDFVNKKDEKLLVGLSKRKDKLNKINECFDFKDIQFMKKPLREICEKYYNSNIRSHVPDIAKIVQQQPIGLKNDPAGIILKKFYQVMIDSKQAEVLNFLSNQLNIREEINNLYL